MQKKSLVLGATLVGLLWAAPGYASENMRMITYGSYDPPIGFRDFCRRHPGECGARPAARHVDVRGGMVTLTPERRAELEHVNHEVNDGIREMSDLAYFGQDEYWSLPTDGVGDCEDFALLKRKTLIALGWPSSALLMTVVRTSWGEGHAVLTARTSEGDLVLDNRVASIRRWDRTGHTYYLRQASADPRTWELVTHGVPMATASGVR